MGLDRQRKTPCGFCFVEYRSRLGAELAKRFVATARLDDRHLLVDWDVGFEDGRQFGRGKSGGQAREAHMPMDNDDRSEFADALAQTLQTMAAASAHLAHSEPGAVFFVCVSVSVCRVACGLARGFFCVFFPFLLLFQTPALSTSTVSLSVYFTLGAPIILSRYSRCAKPLNPQTLYRSAGNRGRRMGLVFFPLVIYSPC
jgi:hypothetical protein